MDTHVERLAIGGLIRRGRWRWMLVTCGLAVVLAANGAAAQVWISSTSDNDEIVIEIAPAEADRSVRPEAAVEGSRPHLKVFRLDGDTKGLLWECDLPNTIGPDGAIVSDDGQSVVTFGEQWGALSDDYMLVFYGPGGVIRSHSVESVLGITSEQVKALFGSMPTWAIPWRRHGMEFFERDGDQRLLCMWIDCNPPSQWLCWDLPTGERVYPDEELKTRLDARGRRRARELLKTAAVDRDSERLSGIRYLGELHNEDDRPLVEAQLTAAGLLSWAGTTMLGENDQVTEQFFHCRYSARQAADAVLAKWDGVKMVGRVLKGNDCGSYLLGEVRLQVQLPQAQINEDGMLWIYLMPQAASSEDFSPDDAQRAAGLNFASWASMSAAEGKRRSTLGFYLEQVPPGVYWLKAVWDRAPPGTIWRLPAAPKPGDYISQGALPVTVTARQYTDAGTLSCTHEVPDDAPSQDEAAP